jgi:hypothetical protein
MTHPLTEVREALAQMKKPEPCFERVDDYDGGYKIGFNDAIDEALATLDRFIAGKDMPRATYVQLTDKGLIRRWQDKPFDDGVLYVRADGQGWQDISSAPKGGRNFLVYTPDISSTFQVYRKQMDETFYCWRNGDNLQKRLAVKFTHWMPLPDVPK